MRAARERLQAMAERITARSSLEVAVQIHVGRRPGDPPPPRVEEAMIGAAREALRNVVRHSGEHAATLSLSSERSGLSVEVRDSGHGFPVTVSEGFGLVHSIRARMEEVDGEAWTGAAPEGGALVRLSWRRPSRSAREALEESYAHTLGRFGGGVVTRKFGYPLLLTQAVIGLATLPMQPRPWVYLVVVALLTAAGVGSIEYLRRLPPRPWMMWAWPLGLTAVITLGLIAARPGATNDYRATCVGLGCVPLILLAYVASARYLVTLLGVPFFAVAVVIILDPAATVAEGVGALNATVTVQLVGWVIGARLRHTARRVERQVERIVGAEREVRHAEHLRRAQHVHLRHTQRVIVPFLRSVADGDLDVRDPGVGVQAALLSAEARDDMYAPGFFDESLRLRVTEFRSRGGTVVIRAGFRPGAYARPVGRVLQELVAGEETPSRKITISPYGTGGEARVVVIPALDPRWQHALAHRTGSRVRAQGDSYATVITVPEATESPE